jgi:hypothetical protein
LLKTVFIIAMCGLGLGNKEPEFALTPLEAQIAATKNNDYQNNQLNQGSETLSRDFVHGSNLENRHPTR